MCGSGWQALPAPALKSLRDEILGEVARISHAGLLTPQERALLRVVVDRTLEGLTGRLYQKALADELEMPTAKQVGVVATRVRAKLSEFYERSADSMLQIGLLERGYEALITYRQPTFILTPQARLAVANAKAALDQRTLPGIGTAVAHLTSALRDDEEHPLLLALTALCYATRAMYGTYPVTDLKKAESIVATIRMVKGNRPWESWFAEACVEMALHWDWPSAEAAFERASALSGGAARRLPWYTAFLASQGRAAEAVPLLKEAVSQAYDSPIVRADLAINQIFAGHYADAQETIHTTLSLFGERTHYLLYVHQAILHEAMGDSAAAAVAIGRVPLKWPKTTITLGLRALFSGLAGDRRTARRHLAKLRAARLIPRQYIPAGQLCIASIGAGDMEAAMKWLREGALVERDPNLVLANVYPFFRHLRNIPEFQSLVRDTMRL